MGTIKHVDEKTFIEKEVELPDYQLMLAKKLLQAIGQDSQGVPMILASDDRSIVLFSQDPDPSISRIEREVNSAGKYRIRIEPLYE